MDASLIIPTFNSCERLFNNLISINNQTCDKREFEVIVTDDGSFDNTRDMVMNFNANFNLKLINIQNNKGRAYARNRAIENAKGRIIIFHDSDMIASKDYIIKHIKSHIDDNSVICGPSWRKIYSYYYDDFNQAQKIKFQEIKDQYYNNVDLTPNKCPLLMKEEISNETFYKYSFELNSRKRIFDKIISEFGNNLVNYNLPWRFFITNNTSVSRKKIIEVGMFDEKYIGWGCEDYDLGYRLYKNSCKFTYNNDLISMHQEHPINPQDNGIKNILYFCHKYDSIDIMLLYFLKLTSINKDWINDIIGEVKVLCRDDRYGIIINSYKKLLYELIYNYENNIPFKSQIDIKSIYENYNISMLLSLEPKLKSEYGFCYLIDSFIILFEDVFGMNLKKTFNS